MSRTKLMHFSTYFSVLHHTNYFCWSRVGTVDSRELKNVDIIFTFGLPPLTVFSVCGSEVSDESCCMQKCGGVSQGFLVTGQVWAIYT